MLFLVAGLVTGVFGGMFGIGGGAILVPMLIYIFKMTQHQAQGTSLAVLLPPVGLFAFLQYHRAGFVDLRAAGWLAAGFMAGAAAGALVAERIQPGVLRRGFGVILLLVALRMILGPSDQVGL